MITTFRILTPDLVLTAINQTRMPYRQKRFWTWVILALYGIFYLFVIMVFSGFLGEQA